MKFKRLEAGTVLEEGDYLFADAAERVAIGWSMGGEPAFYAGSTMAAKDVRGYCKIVVEYDAEEEPTE